jgi:pimeloyl-ACP methyl ester carboxylesterase
MTAVASTMMADNSTPSSSLTDEYQSLTLPDGRILAYNIYGATVEATKLPPVFYFHGFPTSRVECSLLHEPALELGLCMIAIDRPGMGKSTMQENRTLRDWPKDVLALADHLQIDQFGAMGISGGGPFVLACLHDITAARLKAATTVAGMCPIKTGTTGMTWRNRLLFWTARWSPTAVDVLLNLAFGRIVRDGNPETLYELMRKDGKNPERPEVDRAAFEELLDDPKRAPAFVESMREGIRTSTTPAAWELYLVSSDWGFELENVDATRLTAWHGALDANIPVAIADKACEQLSGVRYKRIDDEGHLSLPLNRVADILPDLAERLA